MLETKGSVANSSVSATCITTGSIGCLKMSLAKDDSITSLRLSFPHRLPWSGPLRQMLSYTEY